MADEIDDLLAARAKSSEDDIDTALASRATSASKAVVRADFPSQPTPELPWYQRAGMGFMDQPIGAGQLAQHALPETWSNFIRSPEADALTGVLPSVGAAKMLLSAASGGNPTATTAEVDQRVAEREAGYQEQRKAAGQEGLDWWRVGGNVANPMSWLGPSGGGSTVWQGIKAGARAGAFQSLLQPVTADGNFIWDKSVQGAVGSVAGGTLGGALSLLRPGFSWASNMARRMLGSGADEQAATAAADRVTRETLEAAQVNPANVDPNLYSAIRTEVADALRAGVDPDPRIMANRADAGALPVPVQLTRGQASRDPMAFAWEQRVAGQRGAGEPLSDLLANQNRALIANLNELGAATARSPYDASEQIIRHIQGVDEQLRSQINTAYGAVRDAAGRPARVSNEGFLQAAKSRMTGGNPELAGLTGLADYLPPEIARTYNDIAAGRLPLTVDTIQFLDRAWGGVQRGAQNDTQRAAIGALRNALNETPIEDSLGDTAMQSYRAARQLARQRFELIDSNPAYKAIVDDTLASEPDKFFQKFVQGANVSELRGLKQLIGAENTTMLQNTMVGQLKRIALNKASDENGVFSQAAYNKILQDPVQGPRIREIFQSSPTTLDQLYRVGRVSENLIKIPAASKVNTSNTASATANIIRDVAESETGQAAMSMLPNWMTGLGRIVSNAGQQVREAQAVQQAVSPGVTAAPLQALEAPGSSRLSDLVVRSSAGAAAASAEKREKKRE